MAGTGMFFRGQHNNHAILKAEYAQPIYDLQIGQSRFLNNTNMEVVNRYILAVKNHAEERLQNNDYLPFVNRDTMVNAVNNAIRSYNDLLDARTPEAAQQAISDLRNTTRDYDKCGLASRQDQNALGDVGRTPKVNENPACKTLRQQGTINAKAAMFDLGCKP